MHRNCTVCHQHPLTCRAISLIRWARCSPSIKMAALSWFLHTQETHPTGHPTRQPWVPVSPGSGEVLLRQTQSNTLELPHNCPQYLKANHVTAIHTHRHNDIHALVPHRVHVLSFRNSIHAEQAIVRVANVEGVHLRTKPEHSSSHMPDADMAHTQHCPSPSSHPPLLPPPPSCGSLQTVRRWQRPQPCPAWTQSRPT